MFFPQSSSQRAPPTPAAEGKAGELEEWQHPTVGEDHVQEHLSSLKVHRLMGPDEIHRWVLRELEDEVSKPLSSIFEKLQQFGEVPVDWKRGNIPSRWAFPHLEGMRNRFFLETSWLSHCYTDTTWRGLLRGKSQSSKNTANLSQLWTSLCSNCYEEWLCRSCCLFCCCLIGLGFVLFWRVHLKYSTWLQIVYDLFM